MDRWRKLSGWIGAVCFAVPLIPLGDQWALTHLRSSVWDQPMLLFASLVVTPRTLLTIVALSVGAPCWIAFIVLWTLSVNRPDEKVGQYHAALVRGSKVLRGLTRMVMALAVLLGMLTAGFTLMFADVYHVLAPRSAAGCDIVVSVESAGMAGSAGMVYLKQPDSPRLVDTGSVWMTNDSSGVDPIGDGTWSLVWRHGKAHLNIWGHSSHVECHAGSHATACME